MKQGSLITKIIMFILFAGVVVYLAIYAAGRLVDPFSTAMAYQDVLDDSIEISGMVVRQEQVLAQGSSIMDILPKEGERVAAGETVAILYQNEQALEREQQLRALVQERNQLQYALSHGSSLGDAAKLEGQIIDSILSLRADIAGGDLSNLESDALELRTQVLQREFTYSASSDSAAALNETLLELEAQIAELESHSTSDTSSVRTPCSGLFSQLADGWESELTPNMLKSLTAEEFVSLSERKDPGAEGSVGKLITGDIWYFVTVVDQKTAARLLPGHTITVAFSHDFTGEIRMTIERVGDAEDAGCIVVLSSERQLKDVTLLRSQTVSLIFKRFTGVHVPKKAVRLEAVINPETGEETGEQIVGVYTVTGRRAEFKRVEILREGGDYYLVAPAENVGTKILRAGDEIIVTAAGLYDGKVVLE